MTRCPECHERMDHAYGVAGWCRNCEHGDVSRVLRRDGGCTPADADRLARLLIERDAPVRVATSTRGHT